MGASSNKPVRLRQEIRRTRLPPYLSIGSNYRNRDPFSGIPCELGKSWGPHGLEGYLQSVPWSRSIG